MKRTMRRKIFIYISGEILVLLLILAWFLKDGYSFDRNKDDQSDWQTGFQRETIAPDFSRDNTLLFEGKPTLAISGNGLPFVNGHWFRIYEVVPGSYYRFSTHYKAREVEEEARCILARILWLDAAGDQVGSVEYPAGTRIVDPGGWKEMRQVYQIPDVATRARIELIYRWDDDGKVHFGGMELEATEAPPARPVRLATIHHRPEDNESSVENLDEFAKLIAEAASEQADIVCLPEAITLVGTPLDYIAASEPVPGPTTKYLGNLARKFKMYIVAGILEREGDVVYNTAILMDRDGELAGKYRKLSLPREEIEGGVTPGDELPVFDTDFGRIGMMICWDVTFPETARGLASRGAEIIFLPIWGGNLVLAKARAIENQVYLVSSTYDMKSAVFDLEGELLKEATNEDPVVVVEVNLNQQKLWPWLGDFRNRIPREMPPRKAFIHENY
jgi:predicted amidohydrolase